MVPVSKETEINPCSMKREPNSPHFQTPLLMLLPDQESDKDSVCFLSLEGKRVLEMKSISGELRKSRCVGSSHGWLALLDEYSDPYLLNPFSGSRIPLPPKETFPHLLHISIPCDQGSLVIKAILSLDPSHSKSKYAVIAIYGYEAKLAFFMHGDSAWTDLGGEHRPYCDIMFHKNLLFALSEGGLVEAWDFHGDSFPTKLGEFQPSFSRKVADQNMQYRDIDRYTSRCYLVESSGDLLLLVRYIGEFVRDDGVAVSEGDLLSDEYSQPLICPYKTLEFQVYKLDFFQQKWVEVGSLGDRVLFLGGNHSMSLSIPAQYSTECKRNSIYFTDDYWERMNEDYMYGGHDIGFYSLENKSVEPLEHYSDQQRIVPPPFWVVPNL